MRAKTIMAVMLTGTVCCVILIFIVASVFYPPNTIAETSRAEVWKLLTFILGLIGGYLGKSGDIETPPASPAPAPPNPEPGTRNPEPPPAPPTPKP